MEVQVGIMPQGEDPDSLILNSGKQAMQELVDKAPSLINFLAHDPRPEQQTAERIDLLLDALRSLSDLIKRELLVKDVSEAFGISTTALNSKLHRTSPISAPQGSPQPATNKKHEHQEERDLLILALKDNESYKLLANGADQSYFSNRLYRELFNYLVAKSLSADEWNPAALLDDIENKEIKESLAELLFEDGQHMRFEDCLSGIRIRKIQRDLEEMDRAIIKDPTNLDLLKQKEKLSISYRRMTRKVVNKAHF